MRLVHAFVLLALTASPALAQPRTIPGTAIEDNAENRAALDVCEKYREAVVRRDPETVLRVASPRYRDDAGTRTPSDDVDRATLERSLAALLGQIEAVTYRARYVGLRHVRDIIEVEVEYTGSFRLHGRDLVRHDRHLIRIERAGGRLLIVSGL